MRNSAAIKVKVKANYTCSECGSKELIQGHHTIPGDDSSIIPLCAECHSNKHPELPKALFFSKTQQPYWYNKSAASLAKELGVHSRTVIRASRRLGILKGDLSSVDEARIKADIPKLQWGKREKIRRPKLKAVFPVVPIIHIRVTDLIIKDGNVVSFIGDCDKYDGSFGRLLPTL